MRMEGQAKSLAFFVTCFRFGRAEQGHDNNGREFEEDT